MTIDAVCPHCETLFHLKPEMAGTSMRCPECREAFAVDANAPMTPAELPYERVEAAPPVVLDAEPLLVAKALPLAKALPDYPRAIALPDTIDTVAPRRGQPISPPLMRAIPLRARAVPENEAPKEVDWRNEAPPLAAAVAPAIALPPKVIDFEAPKPPRNIWPLVLTGLILVIVLIGGGTLGKLIYDHYRQEEVLAKEADAAFKDRNYPQAQKLYEQLIGTFADSSDKDRYEFFNALSQLQISLGTVTLKDDPEPGRAKWEAFLKEYGDAKLSRTDDDGYGVDLFDAGRKLVEGYLDHAEIKLKNYRAETAKVQLLTAAEKTVTETKVLLPVVERYRPKDVAPLDEARAKMDGLSGEFARERKRLGVLAPYRDLADDPVEERIAEFNAVLIRNGFGSDSEATALMAKAQVKLRTLLKAIQDPLNPVPKAKEADAAVTLVGNPLGRVAPIAAPTDSVPEVVFAAARGRVFALDADTGGLIWSQFTGRTGSVEPLRFTIGDGGTEFVLLASQRDGQAALSVRVARSGELRWHQEIGATPAGAPVFVGSRVYVALSDAIGTILEFDSLTGQRISSFRLRQRIGPGLVRVPGTTQVIALAEARRLFVLDVAPQSPEGDRLPLRLLHVMTTNHPELSVRVKPVFSGAAADTGPKSLILLQTEGTAATIIRALALPENAPAADAIAAEAAAVELGVAKLPGLVSFPPASDGERIAIVTDTGHFGCYATNAPGNLDPGLYALPSATLPTQRRDPVPGLVVQAGEDSWWVFAQSTRLPVRLTFTPVNGLKVAPRGTPQPWGVPVQPASPVPRRNAISMVDRADDGDTSRVTLFDPASGRVIWERTLGLIAAATPVMNADGSVTVIEANAGLAKFNGKELSWLAAPIQPTVGPSSVASANGVTWTVVPEAPEANGLRVRVRSIIDGRPGFDGTAVVPAALAGEPAIIGGSLLIPLNDGFLYRFDDAAKKFTTGPMWKNAAAVKSATCFPAVQDDTLFATDGDRRIGRWRWPGTGGDWTLIGAPIVGRGSIALAPRVLGTQVVVAELNGTVSVFDTSRPDEPLKRWRPPVLPAGKPTLGLHSFGTLIVYTVDSRHLVALAPDGDTPAWIHARPAADADLIGLTVSGNVLYATDILGTVTAYDATGKVLGTQRPVSRDWLPRAAVAVGTDGRLFLPTVDGSLLTLPTITMVK